MTGLDLPMAGFVAKAIERIPNFAGIKFTHENLMDYARAVKLGKNVQILFGRDEILLAGLAFGATAAVGSTYNFAAVLFNDLIAAASAGEHARAASLQQRAIDFIATFAPYGGLAAQKAMMGMLGFDCGPVRAPLQNLSPAKIATLRAELEQVGFFTFAASAGKIGL